LAELAGEDDPLVVRVAGGVHEQADTYRLRLPETVSWRRCGQPVKPRPVPDVLIDRAKSGLGVYQALGSRPRSADELTAASRYGRATVYRRLAELAELGLARRNRDGRWVRGHRGLVAAGWRTGAFWLRARRLGCYRRERRAWRDRLDGWYRPAALIPAPRSPADPTPTEPASADPTLSPPPGQATQVQAVLAGAGGCRPGEPADPPEDPAEDPWPDHPPDPPDVPEAMVLELLEEVLGAVPIDAHGWRLYPRRRRRHPPPPG
jgi:DNA-binding transcriptional ArsR family regulator